jgi:hypothetical protein
MSVASTKAAKMLFLVAVAAVGYEMLRRARAVGPIGPMHGQGGERTKHG